MQQITLRNGNKIPCLGVGTWKITDRDLMSEIIISDKVWNTSRGYEAVQDACRKSFGNAINI